MKLRDIIENIDKSESNSEWVDFEELQNEFELHHMNINYSKEQNRLKMYWIFTKLDTDTHVGLSALFLDDTFIGLREHKARKGSAFYKFTSHHATELLKDFLLDFLELEDCKHQYIESLDVEMGLGMHLDFSSQLLTDKLVDPDGNSYIVTEKFPDDDKLSHMVGVTNVKRNNGNVLTMDLRKDLVVPFNLQK